MVDIFNFLVHTESYQLIQIIVGTLGTFQNIVEDDQVITGPVADQNVTVPVQNITTGSLDTGHYREFGGVVRNTAGFDDLQGIEPDSKETENSDKDQKKESSPEFCYSFHGSPPMVPMAFISG